MFADIRNAVIASVRRRAEQGDCPTEPPHTIETLENVILDLAPKAASEDGATGLGYPAGATIAVDACGPVAAPPTDATGAEMRERCATFLEARGDELLATSANKSTGNMMREIFRGEAQSIRNLPVAGETL